MVATLKHEFHKNWVCLVLIENYGTAGTGRLLWNSGEMLGGRSAAYTKNYRCHEFLSEIVFRSPGAGPFGGALLGVMKIFSFVFIALLGLVFLLYEN